MDSKGSATRQGGPFIIWVDTLFIQGVSGLMHSTEQRRHRVFFFEMRSNSHVVHIEGSLKGMRCFILTAAAPVITKARDHVHSKIPQFLFVVFCAKEIIFDLFATSNGPDQLHLLRT